VLQEGGVHRADRQEELIERVDAVPGGVAVDGLEWDGQRAALGDTAGGGKFEERLDEPFVGLGDLEPLVPKRFRGEALRPELADL
jgi:hypothetical protein